MMTDAERASRWLTEGGVQQVGSDTWRLDRRLPEAPSHTAYLVRGSLPDDLWNLVVATITTPVELNRTTNVDVEWSVVVGDSWASWNPITESVSGRQGAMVVVADEQTAIDDTVVVLPIGSGASCRIPVNDAAWEALLHLTVSDRTDRG